MHVKNHILTVKTDIVNFERHIINKSTSKLQIYRQCLKKARKNVDDFI